MLPKIKLTESEIRNILSQHGVKTNILVEENNYTTSRYTELVKFK